MDGVASAIELIKPSCRVMLVVTRRVVEPGTNHLTCNNVRFEDWTGAHAQYMMTSWRENPLALPPHCDRIRH